MLFENEAVLALLWEEKMNKIKKILKKRKVWFFIILFAFVYFNNCSFLTKQRTGKPLLLAHRGLAQTFNIEGITNETNTAQRINKPEYPYLENTIPSMATKVRLVKAMVFPVVMYGLNTELMEKG